MGSANSTFQYKTHENRNFYIHIYMSKKRQFKGGIRLSDDYERTDPSIAIDYFMENSTLEVLTNDSISCITLIATLHDTRVTPFLSVRSNTLHADVRKLLLKVFITFPGSESDILDDHDPRIWKEIAGRSSYDGIEITSFDKFDEEVEIQEEIYRKSLIAIDSPLDAICPAIVYVEDNIPLPIYIDGDEPSSSNPILDKLLSLENTELDEIILDNYAEREQSISIIFMELMDGYQKAKELIHYDRAIKKFVPENDRQKIYLYAIQYEFRRLNKLGYKHGDAHLGNVMINTRYRYFSDGIYPNDDLTIIEEPVTPPPGLGLPSSNEEIPEGRIQVLSGIKGRAIILDFGRSSRLTADEMEETNDFGSNVYTREKYHRVICDKYHITPSIYSQLCEKRYHIISRYIAPPFLEKYKTEVNSLVVPEYNEPCDGNAKSGLLHQILKNYILGLRIGMRGGRLNVAKKSIELAVSTVSSHKGEKLARHKVENLPLSKNSFANEIKHMTKEEIKTILINAYNNTKLDTLLHKNGLPFRISASGKLKLTKKSILNHLNLHKVKKLPLSKKSFAKKSKNITKKRYNRR